MDLRNNIEQRSLTLTTLGMGMSGVLGKSSNAHHAFALECGSMKNFVKMREEYLVWTSDQGDDIETPNTPLLAHGSLDEVRDTLAKIQAGETSLASNMSKVVFLPNCLIVPDAEHIIYGALEVIVTTEPEYMKLQCHFTHIAHFLGCSDLVFRTITALGDSLSPLEVSMLKAWSVPHQFSWKWQYLKRFVKPLVCLLPCLIRSFDAAKVKAECDGRGALQNSLIDSFADALTYIELRGVVCCLVDVTRGVDNEGRWMLGCFCHQHILDDVSMPLRKRLSKYESESAGCVMKGRRLVEVVCGHIDSMLGRLANLECPVLKKYLEHESPEVGNIIVRFKDDLIKRLVPRLDEKFSFRRQAPYLYLAAVGPSLGICNLQRAKELVKKGLEHRDAMIVKGGVDSLNRVTVRLSVGEQNQHRIDLERFVGAQNDEELAGETRVLIRDYSYGKVVSRKTEAVHGNIKLAQRKTAWALVNFINYRLKAPEIEAKLSRDTEFWNFCVANYRSRDLNRLLQRLQIQGFLLPRQSQRLKMDLVIMRPSKQRPLMMAMATSLHSPLKSSCLHSRSLLGWNRLV
eukprot:TRINITY_DN2376_c0_g1_i2.p1 TRINITY_DN2376_c0_g1~~TRINITY_DN2376_c0_g1_i2.p1  ORF type:complete len:572 (-),score=68.26 TRINITY_DN2376_c0_g1_i2:377-2092(-)